MLAISRLFLPLVGRLRSLARMTLAFFIRSFRRLLAVAPIVAVWVNLVLLIWALFELIGKVASALTA